MSGEWGGHAERPGRVEFEAANSIAPCLELQKFRLRKMPKEANKSFLFNKSAGFGRLGNPCFEAIPRVREGARVRRFPGSLQEAVALVTSSRSV